MKLGSLNHEPRTWPMSLEARHSPSHLFSLSNELLIEIISNLRPLDIHACQCACRRLNKVIVNSQLIQYTLRTALSGIFDPLEPGISLSDRLDSLERWETAWREMDLSKPIASIDALVHAVIIREPTVSYFGEQHVITFRTGFDVPAGYSFLDLPTWSSSPTNVTHWTTIDIQNPNVLSFAFSPELNLSVAFSASVLSDHQNITVTINPMWFNTGEPHPLASRLKLEVTVSHAAVHNLSEAIVIGDYILYWVGASIFSDIYQKTTLCNIYLVAWKEGWVSELRTSLPGVYGSVLSVLSEEVILLIRLREPALELCRLANIEDSGKASLETIRILSLPVLTSRACLQWVGCTEEHPGHALFSTNHQQHLSYPHVTTSSGTDSSTWQPGGRVGARCRRRLRFVPSDGIVNIVMHFQTLSGHNPMVDLFVRRRTLLGFTDPQYRVGATGVAGTGMRTFLTLPWETWGPANSRILEHDPLAWGWLSGERCAIVLVSRITMQDYNPYRVWRALTLLGVAGSEVTLACGSRVKVVKEASVYRGGECFCNDIETSLPYVETVTSYDGCYDISMDENYLVAEVLTTAGERKLYLHSL